MLNNAKTFRLFISSTFNDFREEREILQTKVFPEIKNYCSQYHYTFQPIDLRWGINSEAQLDQKTLELCLGEVRECKSYMHPNFLVMLGDRYGWLPLPRLIEKIEFEVLLTGISSNDQTLLHEWYREDQNYLPTSYALKERTGRYVNIEQWTEIENSLRTILQNATRNSKINSEQKKKYFLSATEAEIEEGIISYIKPTASQKQLLKQDPSLKIIDPEHVFGFFRDVSLSTQLGVQYISDDYAEAQNLKKRVKSLLSERNILNILTDQINSGSLDKRYLEEFQSRITFFLKSQIDQQITKEQEQDLSPLKIELVAQGNYAFNKRKMFISQQSHLQRISNHITGSNNHPLIIYGKSGIGKTSLMAKAIQEAEDTSHYKVIYRFIGATAVSGSTQDIFESILEELDITVPQNEAKNVDQNTIPSFDREQELFVKFSEYVFNQIKNINYNIVIFVDAVDQLKNDDQFLWLPNKLPNNVKIIISTLSDSDYPYESKSYHILKNITQNIHKIQSFDEPLQLLENLLLEQNRTLQYHQKEYFLKQFNISKSPLYTTIAAQELINWKSFDAVAINEFPLDQKVKVIESNQRCLVEQYLENLSRVYHHDKLFVEKVFGYIYASKYGLSENELLQIFSADSRFIHKIAPETWHSNPTSELPLVIWVRLHSQIKPFLSQKNSDNEILFYFFHREFEDTLNTLDYTKREHKGIIANIETIIVENQHGVFNSNRWGKLHAILISEYILKYGNKDIQTMTKFVSTLNNELWIKEYIEYSNTIALSYVLDNQQYEALAYIKGLKNTLEFLYQNEQSLWIRGYVKSLIQLAFIYAIQSDENIAKQLRSEALNIIEPFYNSDPDTWSDLYTTILNQVAISFSVENNYKEEQKLRKVALDISEELYNQDSAKHTNLYIESLLHTIYSYSQQNHFFDTKELIEKYMSIVEPLYAQKPNIWNNSYIRGLSLEAILKIHTNDYAQALNIQKNILSICENNYKKNPNRWAKQYIDAILALASSYSLQENITLSTEQLKKHLEITKNLYDSYPQRWAKDYSISLHRFGLSLVGEYKYSDAEIYLEKSLHTIKKYYLNNPNVWIDLYASAMDAISISYAKQLNIDKAIGLQEEYLEVVKDYYNRNPNRWVRKYIKAINSLAGSHYEKNETTQAIKLSKKALNIFETISNKETHDWQITYSAILFIMAKSYQQKNEMNTAVQYAEKLIQVVAQMYDNDNTSWQQSYTEALNLLADILSKIPERKIEVEEIIKRSLVVHEKSNTNAIVIETVDDLPMKEDILLEAKERESNNFQIAARRYSMQPDLWKYDFVKIMQELEFADKCGNLSGLTAIRYSLKKMVEISKINCKENSSIWELNYAIGLHGLARIHIALPAMNPIKNINKAQKYQVKSLSILNKTNNIDLKKSKLITNEAIAQLQTIKKIKMTYFGLISFCLIVCTIIVKYFVF